MSQEKIDSIDDLENYAENDGSDSEKNYLTKEQKKQKEFKPSNKTEIVRFLQFDPEKEKSANRFFDKAYFHDVKVGQYKSKVYCNQNDGLPCPLCEKSKQILSKKFAKDDPRSKENYKLGKSYEAREYHIFKLADKGSISHGVKFWRTPKPFSGPSILQKILDGNKQFVRFVEQSATYKQKVANGEELPKIEYISYTDGCDMEINSAKKTLPTNSKVQYWEVSSISPYNTEGSTVYPADKKQERDLLEEIVDWKLIFNKFEIKDVITAEEYLQLCAEGKAPYWDADNKTFQFPGRPDLLQKYTKVRAERASSYADAENGDDNGSGAEDSLEDIEKKYAGVVDNKADSIENMSDTVSDDEDYDDEDDLPF